METLKILLFCNKGFETMEFAPFVDVFGWARTDYLYDVEVITCGFTKTVISAFGISIVVDKTIDEITVDEDDQQTIYSISGVRLKNPQKGLNIINGKKVVVK